MGVDFGGKRIGIAFSDLSGTIATAYEVYVSQNEEIDIDYLTSRAKKRKVSNVVFGLPLNADGTESDQTRWTRDFATKFSEKSEIETDFEDERFSSLEAEELLKEAKMNWKQRKLILDKVAAEIILQNYLNKNKKG